MAHLGRAVGKNRHLAGRLGKAGELELGISGRKIARVRFESNRIGRLERFEHAAPARRIIDDHEAPGLAQAHGRREARGLDQAFQHAVGQGSYTLAGADPAKGDATTIPTVLVPIMLSFDAKKTAGRPFIMDAGPDVARVLRSPIYSKFAFPSGGATQYADAMLRTTFPKAEAWHTLLGKPEVKLVKIAIPVGYGYILTSKKTGASFAVLDVEYLQKEQAKYKDRLVRLPPRLPIPLGTETP